jgi:hypothetical protein
MRPDGRQRDIDDRAVDDIQERDGAQQRERDLAAGCREERLGGASDVDMVWFTTRRLS